MGDAATIGKTRKPQELPSCFRCSPNSSLNGAHPHPHCAWCHASLSAGRECLLCCEWEQRGTQTFAIFDRHTSRLGWKLWPFKKLFPGGFLLSVNMATGNVHVGFGRSLAAYTLG